MFADSSCVTRPPTNPHRTWKPFYQLVLLPSMLGSEV